MGKNYEEEYHKTVHKYLLENKRYYLFRARLGELDYWSYLNKGMTLDFGCGLGQFIYLHKNHAFGADISKFVIKFCKKRGIKVFHINDLPETKFENIMCIHTLEHIEPKKHVKLFKKMLANGGKLLIVLPYPFKKTKDGMSIHYADWDLKNKFDRDYLKNLLKQNDFKILMEKINYHGSYRLFYKLPIKIAYFLLKLFNWFRDSKEYIILAKLVKTK